MKIATIVGARPQFIKAGPVSHAITVHNGAAGLISGTIEEIMIHTGQHYDREMSAVFFEALGLVAPKYNLNVGSGSHGAQLAKMIERLEGVLKKEAPDLVLVYGDTNSTLAAALMADRLQVPIAHVEAGLRSFNRRMPEECNRILTDHVSTLLFAPTETSVENLEREGIVDNVFLVGDVMHEAAIRYCETAAKNSTILSHLRLARKNYSLATVHRAENTDDHERLRNIIKALIGISASHSVVWPVHPRTRQKLSPADLEMIKGSGLKLINPVSYLDMLLLEMQARVILTDSGGVQKEAMWFKVPCITLRDETEWVETVESGWNQIAGGDQKAILRAFEKARGPINRQAHAQVEMQPASKLIVEHIHLFVTERMRKQSVAV